MHENIRSKKKDSRPIYVADGRRFDLPAGLFGELCFEPEKFFAAPRSFKAVVLTGGADINPAIYGHRRIKQCGTPDIGRDARDMSTLAVALRNKVPVLGICRGAQLINAWAGGYLIQDCDNHTMWHNIDTSDGDQIWVSSTHHQMMMPPRSSDKYELLAWASERLSTTYRVGKKPGKLPWSTVRAECDTIFFPRMRALAMQYHPEYMKETDAAFEYALRLIHDKLGLPLADGYEQRFISLPKKPRTLETEVERAEKLKQLSKEQQQDFLEKEWKQTFLESRRRLYRSQLLRPSTAYKKARQDLKDILSQFEKSEQEPTEVSPVRAAAISE